MDFFFSVQITKMLSIREGLQLTLNWNIQVDEIECEVLQVIQNLMYSSPRAYWALISLDIKSLFSIVNCTSCCFIPRVGNKVNHSLTIFALIISAIDSG